MFKIWILCADSSRTTVGNIEIRHCEHTLPVLRAAEPGFQTTHSGYHVASPLVVATYYLTNEKILFVERALITLYFSTVLFAFIHIFFVFSMALGTEFLHGSAKVLFIRAKTKIAPKLWPTGELKYSIEFSPFVTKTIIKKNLKYQGVLRLWVCIVQLQ